jgi:hypothetical protein
MNFWVVVLWLILSFYPVFSDFFSFKNNEFAFEEIICAHEECIEQEKL